jgi:hypothetical protein
MVATVRRSCPGGGRGATRPTLAHAVFKALSTAACGGQAYGLSNQRTAPLRPSMPSMEAEAAYRV